MYFKNLLYALACLSLSVVIGAAVYEHLVFVPQWSAAPPASLSMLQGTYGLKPEAFWMPIHPVTLLLLITSLVLSWKSARRKNILITLGGYVLLLAITAIYFVPELLAITGAPFSNTIDPDLTARAAQWETLSLVRLALLVYLSITLYLGLTKPLTTYEK